MYQPVLYHQTNTLQRYDAKRLMNEFVDDLKLRSDGKDSLIDVGCATGDVLMDFIYPMLPESFTKVIGIDISQDMIQYSKKTYADYKKVDFKVLDIETDNMPLEYHEQFDHVTSIYCLHWVHNQRQALKNIYNMLNKNGNCLLTFVTSYPLFDAYETLASDPRWNEYTKDWNKFMPRLRKDPQPWTAYRKLFKETGFHEPKLEIRDKAYIYKDRQSFRDHMMSVNPFVHRMPLNTREVYINRLCEHWNELGFCEEIPNKADQKYILTYKVVVALATK